MMNKLLIERVKISMMMLLLTGIVSCSNLTKTALKLNLNVSRIGNIQTQDKIDNQVYLKGKVESLAPFIGTGAYELADDTGSIWIFTREKLPNIGSEITIQGKVRYQSIVVPGMGNKDVGDFYVEELARIESQNKNQNQENNEK